MGSGSLGRAELLKWNSTHMLQSVVAGQGHWRAAAVASEATEVVEGSLAGEWEQPP